MMKHSLELEAQVGVKLGGLLTWAFTFPGTPYFAGYRALATNGIDLPVMSAFKLLGRLDGARLPLTSTGARPLATSLANGVRGAAADVDGMATLNGGAVQVLVWNYHDDLVTARPRPVHVAIKLPASFGPRARVSHLRVDETHGDAYTVWVSQGSPQPPSATQIQALQEAMLPQALGAPQTLPVTGGTATLTFSLPRFGVSLLTVSPAAGAVDAGAGGGDAGRHDGGVGPTGGHGGSTTGTRAGRAARWAPRDVPTGQAVPRGARAAPAVAARPAAGRAGLLPARPGRVVARSTRAPGAAATRAPAAVPATWLTAAHVLSCCCCSCFSCFSPPAGRGAPGPSPVGATLRTAQHSVAKNSRSATDGVGYPLAR